jgi:hypothetical protein
MKHPSLTSNDFLMDLVRKRPFLLYKCDQENHLLSTNELAIDVGDEPPILYMSIGNGEFVHKYRKDVTERVLNILNSLIFQISSQIKKGSQEARDCINDFIMEYDDFKIESGPVFIFPDEVVCPSDIVEVNLNNRDVLRSNYKYTWENLEHLMPCSAKVINGNAVSICRSVRKHENILECGVDTVETLRCKGYGSSVVAHWATCVWENGQIPCYSTQWENSASIALAKKNGLHQYAIDILINMGDSL